MHRELRGTDINGGQTGSGGGDRADGGPAWQVSAVHVALQWHAGLLRRDREQRFAFGIARVAQILIDLQHRSSVDGDLMCRFVALGVIGMGGMGHVTGGARTHRHRPQIVLTRTTARQHDSLEHRGQQFRRGAPIRTTADLFVVEQGEHRNVLSDATFDNIDERAGTGVAGSLVVQAGCAQQVVIDPDHSARRQVVGHQLPTEELIHAHLCLCGNPFHEAGTALTHRPDAVDVPLRIERHTGPVLGEMYRELRDAKNRFVDLDQSAPEPFRVPDRQPAGYAQIAVEP